LSQLRQPPPPPNTQRTRNRWRSSRAAGSSSWRAARPRLRAPRAPPTWACCSCWRAARTAPTRHGRWGGERPLRLRRRSRAAAASLAARTPGVRPAPAGYNANTASLREPTPKRPHPPPQPPSSSWSWSPGCARWTSPARAATPRWQTSCTSMATRGWGRLAAGAEGPAACSPGTLRTQPAAWLGAQAAILLLHPTPLLTPTPTSTPHPTPDLVPSREGAEGLQVAARPPPGGHAQAARQRQGVGRGGGVGATSSCGTAGQQGPAAGGCSSADRAVRAAVAVRAVSARQSLRASQAHDSAR
jgi:hypothetical protein